MYIFNLFTVKEKYVTNTKQPLRVVLDSKCRTPKDAFVLDDSAKTLIIATYGNEKQFNRKHIEVTGCKANDENRINLENMLDLLYQKAS